MVLAHLKNPPLAERPVLTSYEMKLEEFKREIEKIWLKP